MKCVMRGEAGWLFLTLCQREALEMIVHKIGRIISGNPHFRDHWADIAGYAKLVENMCDELPHSPPDPAADPT